MDHGWVRRKKYRVDQIVQSGSVAYDPRTLCTYLKVLCPSGSDSVQLKRLEVVGIPTLYEQVLRELSEDTVVLDAKDESNPLHIYRNTLNRSVYVLANRLLNGAKDLTDHEKIMVFMQFISEWYVGLDNAAHYLALGSYIESCGGYSNVLAALAATQGLEARIVNLHNYPVNNGHTVCEIRYDGSWHIYDPTYGAFYTSTPEKVSSPDVLSFEELSDGKGDSPDVTCVVIASDRLTSETAYGFLGPAIYEKANPKGVLDGITPMYYPLVIPYEDGGTTIGKTQFDTSRQGITTLGIAHINYMQNWTITGLAPGQCYQFIVTSDYVGGELGGDFVASAAVTGGSITQNAQHTFSNNDSESMKWVIDFTAEASSVQIKLSHNYQGPEYHYINTESFEIREKE